MLQLGWTSSSAGLGLPTPMVMKTGAGLDKQEALESQVKANK